MTSRPIIRSLVQRYVGLSQRHSFAVLAGMLVLTGVAIVLAKTQLEIKTDLESLLPEGSPSVMALEESRLRTGSTDFYTVAVTSPDPEANIQFIKDAKAEIEKWDETEYIQIDRDSSFFADHALLYLPLDDLEGLHEKLSDEIKLEKKRNNPFFVDLRTTEEKRAEDSKRWRLDAWLAPDLAKRLGLEQDLFDQILAADRLGLEADDDPEGETAAAADPGVEPLPKVPAHLASYLISEDGTIAVLLASLSQPATDVAKSKELMERGTALIERLDPAKYNPEMNARVAGAYRNFKEVESISHDSTIATLASIGFVLLVLLSFFRNGRSLVLLVIPLTMGIIWSVGLTALTFGHLNISTLFVFSMLVGMGIDFGIHFYSRILEEYRAGVTMEEAVVASTMHSGRAMLSAALTTVAALLTLLIAHFQGFVEFGIIASYGIALCLAAAVLVMPPVIFVLERIRATPRKAVGSTSTSAPMTPRAFRVFKGVAYALMFVAIGGAALAGGNWENAEFEHDFRNLRGPKTKTGFGYGKAVGRKKSTSPAMILARSPEQMREVHALLSDRFVHADADSYLKSFVTIQTYVPPHQQEKMEIIKQIHAQVTSKKLKRSRGKARRLLDRMAELSSVKPFGVDEIPGWARRSITERDGTVGAIGFLYSSVRKWDARDVQRFQDAYGTLEVDSGDVHLASSGFILSDVIRTVKSDALRLTPAVFAVLIVVLLVDLRSIKGTLICVLTMAIALLWTIGGMVLFDVRLGLYNMIVLPMVLGTGIDGAIHIYHRFQELGSHQILKVLKTTGLSVVASSMTTLGGFTGLLFVRHLGVKSIGTLAVVGITASVLAVFLFLPGLLLATRTRPPKSDSTEEASPQTP